MINLKLKNEATAKDGVKYKFLLEDRCIDQMIQEASWNPNWKNPIQISNPKNLIDKSGLNCDLFADVYPTEFGFMCENIRFAQL